MFSLSVPNGRDISILFVVLFYLLSVSADAAEIQTLHKTNERLEQTIASTDTVEIRALLDSPGYYDQKQVSVKGEVIGSMMRRRNGVWFNINDGTGAIGVWTERLDIDLQGGSYKRRGSIVFVEGVFNRSCAMHLGQMDIHSDDIKLVSGSTEIKHPVDKWRINILIISSVMLLFILALRVMLFLRRK
jgi:hypothetical protein